MNLSIQMLRLQAKKIWKAGHKTGNFVSLLHFMHKLQRTSYLDSKERKKKGRRDSKKHCRDYLTRE